MKNIPLSLCLVVVILAGGCNDGGSDEPEEDGTVLVSGSFEGDYSPFTKENTGIDIYADTSAPDGNYSLRFTFPSGYTSGYAPGIVWAWWPEPVQELWTQYYTKLSSNFFLHNITQKLTYWYIEDSQTNFFIGIIGTAHGDDTGQLEAELQRGNENITYRYISNTGYSTTFRNDVWYKITVHTILNTNGQSNGLLRVWVDDNLVMDHPDAVYTTGSDADKPVQSFAFAPIFGGMGPATKPATDYIYFDAVTIQTYPFKGYNIK